MINKNKLILFAMAITLTTAIGCNKDSLSYNLKDDGTTMGMPSSRPMGNQVQSSGIGSVNGPTTTVVTPATALKKSDVINDIQKIALKHPACGKSAPGNREALNHVRGYYYGTLFSMARSICRSSISSAKASMLKGSAQSSRDALYNYSQGSTRVRMYASLSSADEKHLRSTYAILLPHGLMESGGDYKEGVDQSNGSSYQSTTAEAGLFQTSYNVRGLMSKEAVKAIDSLEAEYKANKVACETNLFSLDLPSKSHSPSIGSGTGLEFQKLIRSCPALAVEHASVTIRHNMRHYGPLIIKSAKPLTECYSVIDEVYDYVKSNQADVCANILK